MAKVCDKCGRTIEEASAAFCPGCGADLREPVAVRPDPWEEQPRPTFQEPRQSPQPSAPPYQQPGPQQGYAYQGGGQPTYQAPAKLNTMALVGMILGIVSLFLNFMGIMGIAATVCSGIGFSQIKQRDERGKGMAVAGLILGIISIVWGVFALLLLGSMF